MTTHYIDISVVPDPETGMPQLLGALYDKLHMAFVRHHIGDIGVSFPGYSMNPRNLGSRLRLHGQGDALRRLLQIDWLKGLRDHVRMTEISAVPATARHRTITRQQFKTNVHRMRRRRMRRKNETAEQAANAIPSTVEHRPTLPYVRIHSGSTQQVFCLFIQLGPLTDTPAIGQFNSYGLSGLTTVPWF